MKDLIYELNDFKEEFEKGKYTPNEYYNTISIIKNVLNKAL